MSNNDNALGRDLRIARVRVGMRQADLAEAMGVSRGSAASISHWEMGKTRPSLESIARLEAVLGPRSGWPGAGGSSEPRPAPAEPTGYTTEATCIAVYATTGRYLGDAQRHSDGWAAMLIDDDGPTPVFREPQQAIEWVVTQGQAGKEETP